MACAFLVGARTVRRTRLVARTTVPTLPKAWIATATAPSTKNVCSDGGRALARVETDRNFDRACRRRSSSTTGTGDAIGRLSQRRRFRRPKLVEHRRTYRDGQAPSTTASDVDGDGQIDMRTCVRHAAVVSRTDYLDSASRRRRKDSDGFAVPQSVQIRARPRCATVRYRAMVRSSTRSTSRSRTDEPGCKPDLSGIYSRVPTPRCSSHTQP